MRVLEAELTNHAHDRLHVLYGRAGHDAVAKIEYVPGATFSGTQNLFDALLKHLEWCEERDRIKIGPATARACPTARQQPDRRVAAASRGR